MLFFLTFIHQIIVRKVLQFKQKKGSAAVAALIILIINQHIRMISKGSCDTLDWSNS